MENIKKSPVLMGILSCVGCALLLLAIDLILSLITKKTFAEQLSSTTTIIILIVGPIASGISTYMKVKGKAEETEKRKQ